MSKNSTTINVFYNYVIYLHRAMSLNDEKKIKLRGIKRKIKKYGQIIIITLMMRPHYKCYIKLS